jgi:hypothetical protein
MEKFCGKKVIIIVDDTDHPKKKEGTLVDFNATHITLLHSDGVVEALRRTDIRRIELRVV